MPTIDERLDRLAKRHDPLLRKLVKQRAAQNEGQLQKRFEEIASKLESLLKLARVREKREDGQP
jgi:hypothetical protein